MKQNRQQIIVNSCCRKNIFSTKFLFTLFFGLLLSSAFAAKPTYFKTIQKTPLDLYINTTNDIFLMKKGMLERYYSDGTFFQNYGSIYINERTEIISANGFKTILFSPDFGKIIQLDNRLKEIDDIDAYNLGTYIITCVGISYDNNYLWLFDASAQRLIKIDKDKTPVFTSNTLSMLVGKTIKPKQIIESGIMLYLVDLENGIFIFDNQGNYVKNIPIKNARNVKVIDGIIYYTIDNCIYSYDNLTFSETRYTETPDLKQIQIGKTIICGINKEGFVEIWKF
jgi:hypothetical protein